MILPETGFIEEFQKEKERRVGKELWTNRKKWNIYCKEIPIHGRRVPRFNTLWERD